jgi:hypothetical protein
MARLGGKSNRKDIKKMILDTRKKDKTAGKAVNKRAKKTSRAYNKRGY